MQPVASDRSDAIEIDRIADASRAHRGQAARTRGRANVKQSNRRSRRVSILPGLRLDARAQFQKQISTPSPKTARAVRSKGAASRTITNRANSVRSAILQDGTSTIWRAFFSRRITASFVLLLYATVKERAKFVAHTNSHNVWRVPGVRDVTPMLADAARSLEAHHGAS